MNERGDRLMRAFMASVRADREVKCQRIEQDVQMRELIVDTINHLRNEVLKQVPEKGDFEFVYKNFKNPNNNINLSVLRLQVSPVGFEEKEKMWLFHFFFL